MNFFLSLDADFGLPKKDKTKGEASERLMFLAKQIVDGLHRIESDDGHFH
jgi:hypothetical protein